MRPGGSRRKGTRFEREIARLLSESLGEDCRRGCQARDGSDSPDVLLDGWWIECKRGRRPNIMAAMEQATCASTRVIGRARAVPVAICRADLGETTCTMYLEDWIDLLKRSRGT